MARRVRPARRRAAIRPRRRLLLPELYFCLCARGARTRTFLPFLAASLTCLSPSPPTTAIWCSPPPQFAFTGFSRGARTLAGLVSQPWSSTQLLSALCTHNRAASARRLQDLLQGVGGERRREAAAGRAQEGGGHGLPEERVVSNKLRGRSRDDDASTRRPLLPSHSPPRPASPAARTWETAASPTR